MQWYFALTNATTANFLSFLNFKCAFTIVTLYTDTILIEILTAGEGCNNTIILSIKLLLRETSGEVCKNNPYPKWFLLSLLLILYSQFSWYKTSMRTKLHTKNKCLQILLIKVENEIIIVIMNLLCSRKF